MTEFRTSTSALGVVSTSLDGVRDVDGPLVSATQVIDHPGTHPTVTVPMSTTREFDLGAVWAHLAETADFFGVGMPSPAVLADAIDAFAARTTCEAAGVIAVTVTITADPVDVLVTGARVRPFTPEAIRLDVVDGPCPLARLSDPPWRRMAGRTTSRGEADALRRWLIGRGFADCLSAGVPVLGGLLWTRGGAVFGLDDPEPTSVLDQLRGCGLIAEFGRDARLADADRLWWVSPEFSCHPVAAVGAATHLVDARPDPPFARWS